MRTIMMVTMVIIIVMVVKRATMVKRAVMVKGDEARLTMVVTNLFMCRDRERTYRVRADKAYWCIAGLVATL